MQTNERNVDSPASLAAATWLGIVGSFVLLILPVFIGTLMEYRMFSRAEAGWIGSADLTGFALASGLAFRTVPRVDWRRIVSVGLVLIICGDVASMYVSSFSVLVAVRLLLSGIGAGLVISVAYTLLGDRANPARSTGIYFSFNVLGGAVGLLVVPLVVKALGAGGLFAVLAITGLSGLPVALFGLPNEGRPQNDLAHQAAAASWATLVILAGIALFNFGMGGIWAFVERIGLETGLAGERVGQILSLTYLVSMLGSAAAAWQAERFGYLGPYIGGTGILCAALAFLVLIPSASVFVLALVLINFGWNYCLTYQFSAVFHHDRSGRMAVFIILVQACGLMFGPGAAGTLAQTAGYDAAILLAGTSCIASVLLFVLAPRLQDRTAPEAEARKS